MEDFYMNYDTKKHRPSASMREALDMLHSSTKSGDFNKSNLINTVNLIKNSKLEGEETVNPCADCEDGDDVSELLTMTKKRSYIQNKEQESKQKK
jgi:hypothetical protein